MYYKRYFSHLLEADAFDAAELIGLSVLKNAGFVIRL